MDEARCAHAPEMFFAPRDHPADRLGGVALAMRVRCENPADLGSVSERRINLALEVDESQFTEELARGFIFCDPEAEAEHGPVSGIAQQARPDLLARLRLARGV